MKTKQTTDLERALWKATNKQGVFGCFEVTIGWFGDQRADYMTYDCKGVFRCYEIKVSRADFHSSVKKSFVGHYNYYVMPKALYEDVKDEIPAEIGVYTEHSASIKYPTKLLPAECVKKAKRQALRVEKDILKDSMIRSLSRDAEKYIKNQDEFLIQRAQKSEREALARARAAEKQCWALTEQISDLKLQIFTNIAKQET